jgi:hypothetical protein
MAQSKRPQPRTILFDATHFNIAINPAKPPPPASTTLLAARQQTNAAWEAFEAAENALVQTDEEVRAEVLNYISSLPRRATNPAIEAEKAHLTSRIHVPRIETTETCCHELEINAQALEDAAFQEPETVEAQATMKIDLVMIRSCLAKTREIVRIAQIRLDQARRTLKPS